MVPIISQGIFYMISFFSLNCINYWPLELSFSSPLPWSKLFLSRTTSSRWFFLWREKKMGFYNCISYVHYLKQCSEILDIISCLESLSFHLFCWIMAWLLFRYAYTLVTVNKIMNMIIIQLSHRIQVDFSYIFRKIP